MVTIGAAPRTEPHISSIAELVGLSWTFAEEQMDVEDFLNTANFARLEHRGAREDLSLIHISEPTRPY